MGTLVDALLRESIRGEVVEDYVRFIDEQVASKKGPTGMMIKAAYKSLKGVKPGYMQEVVEVLLPSFMGVLDARHDAYRASPNGASFDEWITPQCDEVADELLGITDEAVRHSDKKVVQKVYKGIRKIAQKNVAPAVPGMARVAMKHMV